MFRYTIDRLRLGIATALLMIVLLSFGTAGAGAYTEDSSVTFTGHVYYSDGVTPVSGAGVYIYYPYDAPASTGYMTTADGSYTSGTMTFNGKSVGYIVNKDGTKYVDVNDMYTVPSWGGTITRDFNISLAPPARPTVNFQGHVRYDESGVPAALTINYGGIPWEISADSTGYYDLGVFYAGGSATIVASYDGQTSTTYTVTPDSGSIVTTDIMIPLRAAPGSGYIIRGHAYYNGNPVSGIGIWLTCLSGTGGMNASDDGSFNFSATVDGGERTYWARYNGIDSPTYVITPVAGETYTHDFYITGPALSTVTPTPTPTPTPTATPSLTGTITPTPLPSPSATISPVASLAPNGQNNSSNATENASLTASPSIGPSASASLPSVSPASGISVTYVILGIGLIIIVLAAAAFLVLRKKS